MKTIVIKIELVESWMPEVMKFLQLLRMFMITKVLSMEINVEK